MLSALLNFVEVALASDSFVPLNASGGCLSSSAISAALGGCARVCKRWLLGGDNCGGGGGGGGNIKGQGTKILQASAEPPLIPGSLLFGNGPQFSANAVEFLLESRRKFGDLFCVRFPGQRIHILMDPHRVADFGRVKELDFGPIHEQVTNNVFNFRMPNPHKMLREASKSARAALKDDITGYQMFVDEGLDGRLGNLKPGEWRSEMLDNFLGDTQFRAIFNCIFGRSDDSQFNHSSVRKLFADIHASFNYVWLGLPIWLFPRTWAAWRQVKRAHPKAEELLAREDCGAYMSSVMKSMMESGESEASIVGHNMVYLHVNYNTKKATYWAFNNLLRHPSALAALRAEVDAAIEDRAGGDSDAVAEFSIDEIDRLPMLDSFVKETFRLASGVFMIRQVTADATFEVGGRRFVLRKGDKAAVYPPALHRDPEMYDNPNEFRFDRFAQTRVEFRGKPVSKPILPYGLLCPGQRLSMVQIKWFLFVSLARMDLSTDGDRQLAEYDFGSYGHEILPPVRDISFRYAARESRVHLQLRT